MSKKDKIKQIIKTPKKLDLVVGNRQNDQDHLLHTKLQANTHQKTTANASVQSKQKTKDSSTSTSSSSSSRTCRCTPKQQSSTTSTSISTASGPGRSSKSTSTVGTSVNTAVASILRNPKDLPIRDYEKLSPIPSANYSNSAKSSVSSSTSNMLDALIASNNCVSIDNGDDVSTSSGAAGISGNVNNSVVGNSNNSNKGNHKTLAINKITSTNNQIDELAKTTMTTTTTTNDQSNNADNIEMINLNVLNNKHMKKLSQSQQTQPQCNNNSTIVNNSKNNLLKNDNNSSNSSDNGTSGNNINNCNNNSSSCRYAKSMSNDDTLILKICDLEYTTKRTSTSSASSSTSSSASNPNGRINNARPGVSGRTKVRTKTDPHPISSPQRQRRQASTTTNAKSTFNLNQYHKCSPRIDNNKCNCSSCCVPSKLRTSSTSSSSSWTDNTNNKTKSVGTQHDATNAFDPWIKQNTVSKNMSKHAQRSTAGHHQSSKVNAAQKFTSNSKATISANAKVIVITDDFKKKALNQQVLIDTKRKILRYMKTNKLMSSSRSMDDVRISSDDDESKDASSFNTNNDQNPASNISESQKTTGENANKSKIDKNSKTKAISKSVDNVSLLSAEMDALDNVGSVELIFISDEFLNEVSNQNVIVLKKNSKIPPNFLRNNKQQSVNDSSLVDRSVDNGSGGTALKVRVKSVENETEFQSDQSSDSMATASTAATMKTGSNNSNNNNNTNNGNSSGKINKYKKQVIVVSDNFRKKSLKDKKIVIVDEPKRRPGKLSSNAKLNRQSSGESSIDDVNNKITSHAFQSYDEESEDLESKEIQSPDLEEFTL